MDWDDYYQCDYQYDEREDDIYSGQYHDDEDDCIDCPFCEEQVEEQEKPVKQEWIELQDSYDPFEENEPPKQNQMCLFWQSRNKYVAFHKFDPDWHKPSNGFSHWIPAPEGPVKLLKFGEVIEGSKSNKKYQRVGWNTHDDGWPLSIDGDLLSLRDIQAEDWIEVG